MGATITEGAPSFAPPTVPTPFNPLGPLPTGTVLLEASAGTGKTFSIASLVLRLVAEERVPIDRILVVTFTEAATTELRERVRGRLRDAHAVARLALARASLDALDGPRGDDVTRHVVRRAHAAGTLARVVDDLRAALERFDDAAISTIHGFCDRVLRERAFECGATLDGELLTDTRDLVDEVARDFWALETADRPAALVHALQTTAKIDLASLAGLVKTAVAHPDAPCEPAVDAVGSPDRDAIARCLAERARRARDVADRWTTEEASEALELLAAGCESGDLSLTSWKPDYIDRRASVVAAWAAGDPEVEPTPGDMVHFGIAKLRGATKKGRTTPTHALFDAAQTLVDADAALKEALRAEALRIERSCVAWARAETVRRKRDRGQHDYDDLLRLVRDALRRDDGALGRALRDGFHAVLIDEFQDTDEVQWEIFRRAFADGGHRLLLIGDPKQAIYRFRGADIHTYLTARGDAAAHHALDTNWRSDAPLVSAIAALRGAHGSPFATSGIAWHDVHARRAPRLVTLDGGPALPLEVRLLARVGELETSAPTKPIAKGVVDGVLPDLVATDVARFLQSGARIRTDEGAERAVGPSDVAVLVRSNAQARVIQAALRAAGVPAVIHGASSVFGSREATELAAVLAAVLEPTDLRLARVALATDLLGLAAARELATAGERLGAGDALARLEHDDAGWERWSQRLRDWRATWRGERTGGAQGGAPSVMRLVRRVLDDLSLAPALLELTDGERRLTNLLHVAELLHADAVRASRGPSATLAWLREQIALGDAPGDDETRQLRLESDADAAQVVTVHSSKGLEYGAVWCPYLWTSDLAHPGDKRQPCVHVERDGARVRTLHLRPEKGDDSLRLLDDECFVESLRLMYVALTRARHRLTLWWGAVNGFDASSLAWLLHGGEERLAAASEARQWLGANVAKLTDDELAERVESIAARHPTLVRVARESYDAAARYRAPVEALEALHARPYRRTARLDEDWRVGSFTSLTRAAAHGAAADAGEPGDDVPESIGDVASARAADASEPDADADAVRGPVVPLADFAASAAAGICVHEILEAHDYTAADGLRAIVDAKLDAFRFGAAEWGERVSTTLAGVLATPLVGDDGTTLRLDRVARERRLVEMRFDLPVHGGVAAGGTAVSSAALARAFEANPGGALTGETLRAYADRVATLGFRPLRGFLHGAIDLVAEQDGRWWLVDWKSNRLGRQGEDYATDRLLPTMLDAHYVLQYHLYALALHRFLRLRVPGYDYARDVGGAFYVFVRGVGAGRGVFHDRPPASRIQALDALFEGGA